MSQLLRKVFTASATKGLAPRQFRFTISSETVDRDNDVIRLSAWDLSEYRTNPVVLASHATSNLPVGKSVDIGVQGGTLQATVEFPPPGLYAFADTVHDMVKAGFLRGASVGFRPTDTEPNPYGGLTIKGATLLEWSICSLGSNPDALVHKAAPSWQMQQWLKRGGVWRDDREPFIRIIDEPTSQPKEDPMRYLSDSDVVLTLKDSPAGDQSANLAEVTATLLEQARAIDATFRTMGIAASIADIVRQMMSPEKLPQQRAVSPHMEAWLASQEKFKAEQHMQRLGREYAAAMAVPESKRFRPGFQRIF